ncbi:hypothetical protein [Streptomyces sp. DSM 15324]|uniref:hypothetical protein n=1 Tax=Streptomyces sp. DSM 15324 TaxID=1739111 RepID=UPI0007495524|nr:hypothetical protein [Streptomyces sp. DSM 15324]KUO14041.1 hypothetical protein AQJ58_03005 [Streptomyces sp. DSM 15324]
MKSAVLGAVAAGLLVAGTGAAVADSWHRISLMETTGASFREGRYRFNAPEREHGSFEWKGKLSDTEREDGHNVYMLVRVEGHSWVRYRGKQGKAVSLHGSNWDGAQLYTSKAEMRVCRDRGSLRPDNCSRTRPFSNPR